MAGSNALNGIVTTPRKQEESEAEAQRTAQRCGLPFIPRGDTSIESLFKSHRVSAIYIVGNGGRWIQTPQGRVAFHEGTAVLRTREDSSPDPLITSMGLKPTDNVLDATLGLGVDALVTAYSLGSGTVTGIECNPMLEDMVRIGMKAGRFTRDRLRIAAGRISTVCADHQTYLANAADKSFDIVYFDPMFVESVEGSAAVRKLRCFAEGGSVDDATVKQARRVARRRVVLKGRRGFNEDISYDRVIPSGKSIFYGIIEAD